MKKYIILVLSLTVLLSSCYPASAKWVELGQNSSLETFYIDDDMNDEGSYCTIRLRQGFPMTRNLPNGRWYTEYIQILAFPLKEVKGKKVVDTDIMAIVADYYCDSYDNLVAYNKDPNSELNWKAVPVGSFIERVSMIAAKCYDAKFNHRR